MVFFTARETQQARRPRCTKRVRRPIKTTPRHVGRDTSVRSKSGEFLFNQIFDPYRCSPRAHASRVVRTRALATCVMAEPRALYGMCSKADTYAARETCMDLPITMYLWPSLAAADSPRMVNVFSSLRPAKLRSSRGVLYSVGRVGTRGAGVLIGTGRTPKRACGTLGRSPGHGLGVFAG